MNKLSDLILTCPVFSMYARGNVANYYRTYEVFGKCVVKITKIT